MYRLLDIPRSCADLGGWNAVVGKYTEVAGWTHFGDFFLRNPNDGKYAMMWAMSAVVWPLRFTDRESFEGVFLKRGYVVKQVLRPGGVLALSKLLGELGPEDIFIPAVCPYLAAGTPDLSTYHKGNVWAFATYLAECHGFGKGAAVDAVPLHLMRDDDYELWRVALDHILSELPKSPGVFVQIGRCSHWLRPHQTRWKADGGFAWPTGYGGTAFSRNGLPEYDWSFVVAWTGERWEEVKTKTPQRHPVKTSLRITIPSRTKRHPQAAVHTLWMRQRTAELRFYGFRHKEDGWHCTAEDEWAEERAPKGRKKRRGNKRVDHS